MKHQITLAHFGQNVRRLRLAAGLSEEDLAQKCKSLRYGVPQLEAGAVNPTLSMVVAIAQALGVDPGALVDGAPQAAFAGEGPHVTQWRGQAAGLDEARADVDE